MDKETFIQTKCKGCDSLLPKNADKRNTFCSKSCAARYNNQFKARRKKEYFCRYCNSSLIDLQNKHFCSNKCQSDWCWDRNKIQISETGIYPGADYNYVRVLARRFIRESIGWKCSICGIKEWMGEEAPMVVDHEDGNAENNRIDNVRLVCGNCNMMLPTFSGRNRGSGRAWRKERRDFGKNA